MTLPRLLLIVGLGGLVLTALVAVVGATVMLFREGERRWAVALVVVEVLVVCGMTGVILGGAR